MSDRRGRSRRSTAETDVECEVGLDAGPVHADTGVPFFDHMLAQLGKHGRLELRVKATGDLEVDAHHTVEDVGTGLGAALSDALGDRSGIRRYGDALVPMDEALAQAALDISGRTLLVYHAPLPPTSIGRYDTRLTREFLHAMCRSAGLTLHVRLLAGSDPHHCVEAIFKAVGRAIAGAVAADPSLGGEVPSTKGRL